MFTLSHAATCLNISSFQDVYKLKVDPLTLKDVTERLEKGQHKHPQYWIVVPVHELESVGILHMTGKVSCVVPTLGAV